MKFEVKDDKKKRVAILDVNEKRLKVSEQSNLFKEVMKVPLDKGLEMIAGGSSAKGHFTDKVVRIKEFNTLNLGLLEQYLMLHGYTLGGVK